MTPSEMTPPEEELLPATRRSLLHRLAQAQSQGRAPSMVAAVARDGVPVWSAVRSGERGRPVDAGTQFRVGSITKTFTAVLVMRLRDEGLLDLSDPLEKHLPGTGAAGEATIADLLAHTGGLAAETPGPWWERSDSGLRPTLAEVLGKEPMLHPVGRRHHYSNPGYTLLGSLVATVRGRSWEQSLHEEIIEPLALSRTSISPVEPSAAGWAVHPWVDVTLPEPALDLGLMAPAGQMWSTAGDLARFAGFLMSGDERVLAAETLEEMRRPAAPMEPSDLGDSTSYGLGLQLAHRGGRLLAGHSGSLPGYLANLTFCAEEGLSVAVLANCTSGPLISGVGSELLGLVADSEPRIPEPWSPSRTTPPSEELEMAGPWYWGTQTVVLRLNGRGGLSLGPADNRGRRSRFRDNGDGTWTGLDGYYAGELLRGVRREDGSLSHLDLGSFVFTRKPYDTEAPVPGGVDAEGWRGLP